MPMLEFELLTTSYTHSEKTGWTGEKSEIRNPKFEMWDREREDDHGS